MAWDWSKVKVDNMVVKVADFGLSRFIIVDGSQSLSVVGTICFLAPEIRRHVEPPKREQQEESQAPSVEDSTASEADMSAGEGGVCYDFKADIFSIGILTDDMATKSVTCRNKREASVQRIRGLTPSSSLNNFILSATEKDPKKRPSARELLSDKFVREPDRAFRKIQLGNQIRRIRCTELLIIVICEDERARLIDAETFEEIKELSQKVNKSKGNHRTSKGDGAAAPTSNNAQGAGPSRSRSLSRSSSSSRMMEDFPLASTRDKFAMARAGRIVEVWEVRKQPPGAKNGQRVKIERLPDITFGNDQENKITWLGLSDAHVVVLFDNSTVESRFLLPKDSNTSKTGSDLQPWIHSRLEDVKPWQMALETDSQLPDMMSILTVVCKDGKEIHQFNLVKNTGSSRLDPWTLTDSVEGMVLAADETIHQQQSRQQAAKKLIWVSNKGGVSLLDAMKSKEILYIPKPGHSFVVSRIGHVLGMLVCHLTQGEDTCIIAYNQGDVEPTAESSSSEGSVRKPKLRVISRYKSEWKMRLHQVGDGMVVYGIADTLNFLRKSDIMAMKEVDNITLKA